MSRTPDELGYIEAELTMLSTQDGGRKAPIRSGYRPNWWLPSESERVNAGGTIELAHGEELAPGSTGTIRIYPFVPEAWENVGSGTQVDVNEGPDLVGRAVVTQAVRAVAVSAATAGKTRR